MSKPPNPSSSQPPGKTMSSRLLTMKFMQRAAASTPSPSSPQTNTPPSKRLKTTHSTPTSPATPLTDQAALQAAIAASEAQREAAIARVAAERGETKWVLSFVDTQGGGDRLVGMEVVRAGYAELDDGGEDEKVGARQDMAVGRRSFGSFNRELEKQQKQQDDSTDNSFSSSDDSGSNSDGQSQNAEVFREPTEQALQRAKTERKAKKKAAKAEAMRMAEEQRAKEVQLDTLTSISGTIGRNPDAHVVCHGCGGKGHKNADCPNKGSKRKRSVDWQRPGKKSKMTEPLDY